MATSVKPVLPAIVVLLSVVSVRCFPGGAPPSICLSLYTKHYPYYPQTTPSPYAMETNATAYEPGDTIAIRLYSPTGKPFRGFQIRVRRVEGDTEELVGQFLNIPDNSHGLAWYPQIPDTYNCVTHSSATDKTEVSFEWQAPAASVGDVVITASFAMNFHEFWLANAEVSFTAMEPSADEQFLAEVSTTFDPIDYSACGVTKGCFQYPRGCSGEGCTYLVTYEVDEDSEMATLEMKGVSPGYISLAFADDKLMPQAHTSSCLQNDEFTVFQNGHNPTYHNEPDRSVDFRNIQITREGDVIYCRFTRPLVLSQGFSGRVETEYDIRSLTYLQLGWGTVKHGAAVMDQHVELPLVSDTRVNVLEKTIISGVTIHMALAAHAVLGLISWLAFAGVFMMTARHYRSVFTGKLCGTGAWFQTHRVGLIVMMVIATASIIVIFVYLKAWTLYNTVHAVLGLIAMGLALCLIVSGFLRPNLDSSKRVLFNWGHRLTGCAAWILAAVSCVLGADVSLLQSGLRSTIILIIVIWILFHLVWALMLEALVRCYFDKGPAVVSVSKDGETKVEDPATARSVRSRKSTVMIVLYIIYILITLAFLVASSYYICLF